MVALIAGVCFAIFSGGDESEGNLVTDSEDTSKKEATSDDEEMPKNHPLLLQTNLNPLFHLSSEFLLIPVQSSLSELMICLRRVATNRYPFTKGITSPGRESTGRPIFPWA